ncbi:pentraxin-related protein PTX3-like [Anguilla anguilla]|uniref:pentraxin-related protein PTX3-like n=1 Tax=Anguilla anguilla TaxID=7936 RepID=UPI0015AEAF9D|nr:pentraxin-related protein PTX3-like [Anguilla anguilla]
MALPRVLLAGCLLLCCRAALGYEEDYAVAYDDSYFNEIPVDGEREAGPTDTPWQAEEASRWDKLFIMMEDSQMRQNMLLHSLDTVVGAELRALGAELRRQVAGGDGAACAGAAAAVGERLSGTVERAVERVRDAGAETAARQDAALQRLLEAGRDQAARLHEVEGACLKRAGPGQQEVTSGVGGAEVARLEKMVAAVATDLQRVRAQLEASQRLAQQNFLPSGCDTALLFPMRSRSIHAVVRPEDDGLPARSLTVCLWAKPTQALNRTVLFSYGTRRNPQGAQLLLSGGTARFAVGGGAEGAEGAVAEAQGAAEDGRWGHYCGTWSPEQGRASLWADGRLVATATGAAAAEGGHALPEGGVMLLGQEWNHMLALDPRPAFAGKLTGFNVWDRVLTAEEISQHARLDGSCGAGGNVVGWGVSSILPRGGAKYVN